MPKKSFKRKKAAQAARCEQHKKGLINDTNGNWMSSSQVRVSTIYQMCMSGSQHRKV